MLIYALADGAAGDAVVTADFVFAGGAAAPALSTSSYRTLALK
jgi:hypothetical protein